MRKKLKLKQQGLADIRLTNAYLFEPFTAKVLGACDIDGNAVAVYGKQYHDSPYASEYFWASPRRSRSEEQIVL